MFEFFGGIGTLLAILAAVGAYALLWRISIGQSSAGKILLRIALPALLLLPVAAFIYLGSADRSAPEIAGSAPPGEMEGGSGLAKKAAKPVEAEPQPSEEQPEATPPAEAAPPPPPPATAAPEPAPAVPPPEERDAATRGATAEPPGSTEAGSRADASAAPAAEAEKPNFSVVPVYFGTDRARMPEAKRLNFGLERARKLELGQALVSVPLSHEVPQIERPWSVRIPYFDVKIYEETEDPSKHFTMREMRSLTREEFLALVKERLKSSSRFKDQAFIFVHGFNTTFDNAVFRTAQIAHDLKFDGAPFLYSWPSGGGVASYTYDRESSGQSEPFMRDFMELVVSQSGAKAVSVIAHSMGNQPVLQVLKDMRRVRPDVVIDQIILAAPDVDRDNFENIANEIRGLAKGITLYVAANDRALGVSRRFHGGVPRAGDVPTGGPLVLPGVDTIDVTGVSTDSLGINHSGYAESNALLNDIGLLIQTGERPPDKRIPILSKITTPKGEYWKYPVTP
jgi:esterase/lipase superfamily enzyme